MAAGRQKSAPATPTGQDYTVPQQPQAVPPPNAMPGGIDSSFIWQQLSQIQGALGGVQQSITDLTRHSEKHHDELCDRIKAVENGLLEIDKIRHTTKVVTWIVGISAGSLLAIAGWIANEVWGVVKPLAFQALQQQATDARNEVLKPSLPEAQAAQPPKR